MGKRSKTDENRECCQKIQEICDIIISDDLGDLENITESELKELVEIVKGP